MKGFSLLDACVLILVTGVVATMIILAIKI